MKPASVILIMTTLNMAIRLWVIKPWRMPPGVGLVVAGPLAAAFAGAGVGGLAGGLIGALVGSGVPEETAKAYESGLKGGGIVVGVTPRNQADEQYLTQQGFQ
jgi:anti-sigma factor RsiW